MLRIAHPDFVQAGLHPSATGKWVQALSCFPLGQGGSDGSPRGCAEPLAAALGQLQSLPCSQCGCTRSWLGAAAVPGWGSERLLLMRPITRGAIDRFNPFNK